MAIAELDNYEALSKLCEVYGLGSMAEGPVEVSGGLMHKMYRIRTGQGTFAVKKLNAVIVKRDHVLDHINLGETTANAFSDIINVVAARKCAGSYVTWSDGNYYMVYDWVEGKSIFAPDIREDHCRQIGDVLGKIHSRHLTLGNIQADQNTPSLYEWEGYLCLGREQQAAWIPIYQEMLQKLKEWNKSAVKAVNELSKEQTVSHRDLDPKNVMWNNDIPWIIDWEAAGYTNPYMELSEALFYWTAGINGQLKKNLFMALLTAYRKYIDTRDADWNMVTEAGYLGMLGWLEYNIKRALGLEASSGEERKLGEGQVLGALEALQQYTDQIQKMKSWMV